MTAFNGEFVRLFILAMNFGRQPPLAMVNMTKAMEFCCAIAVNTPWASATPTAHTIMSQGPAAHLRHGVERVIGIAGKAAPDGSMRWR